MDGARVVACIVVNVVVATVVGGAVVGPINVMIYSFEGSVIFCWLRYERSRKGFLTQGWESDVVAADCCSSSQQCVRNWQ
jgi:hypothetical protein